MIFSGLVINSEKSIESSVELSGASGTDPGVRRGAARIQKFHPRSHLEWSPDAVGLKMRPLRLEWSPGTVGLKMGWATFLRNHWKQNCVTA